jgi:uncharacterized membrane protein (DUF106 family)
MDFIVLLLTGLNSVMNSVAGALFAPVAVLPGWLSITVISAVLGVLLLLIFKYTSNQKAIGSVRDEVNANLIAAWLFKDSISVTIKSQSRVFVSSFKLLYFAVIPMLVMIVPVSLILAQMGLWYQARPLSISDESVVVRLKLNESLQSFPSVRLEPSEVFQKTTGPVKIVTKGEVLWELKPLKNGRHELNFDVNGNKITKQFVVGDGFMKVSLMRPGRSFEDILLHPLEKPFSKESPVYSINVEYPERDSKVCGTDWWILYFFICSMVFAFAFKPFLNVRI